MWCSIVKMCVSCDDIYSRILVENRTSFVSCSLANAPVGPLTVIVYRNFVTAVVKETQNAEAIGGD